MALNSNTWMQYWEDCLGTWLSGILCLIYRADLHWQNQDCASSSAGVLKGWENNSIPRTKVISWPWVFIHTSGKFACPSPLSASCTNVSFWKNYSSYTSFWWRNSEETLSRNSNTSWECEPLLRKKNKFVKRSCSLFSAQNFYLFIQVEILLSVIFSPISWWSLWDHGCGERCCQRGGWYPELPPPTHPSCSDWWEQCWEL